MNAGVRRILKLKFVPSILPNGAIAFSQKAPPFDVPTGVFLTTTEKSLAWLGSRNGTATATNAKCSRLLIVLLHLLTTILPARQVIRVPDARNRVCACICLTVSQ